VSDQASNIVNYTYDAANQLQSVQQVKSPNTGQNTTSYAYDPLGDLSSSTDANSHITLNGYDLLGEITSKKLPDGTLTESRTYDAAGNLKTVTHFNGKTTAYAYDSLNRLLSRTPDSILGEPTVSFTYTATGKRQTMTDGSGTTTYGYDSADRLFSKATPAGTLSYTYDAAGHVASISSSNTNGASMSYTYDNLGRLSTVVDSRLAAGHNTTTYSYDDAYNVATVTYPNSLITAYTYDQLNRVTGTATSNISNYTYQLGPTGNRTSVQEQSGRTATWNYDDIYRLTSETVTSDPAGVNGSLGYGLDPVGNRQTATSTISGLAPISGTFNADDELASESYDQNGNVTATGGKTFAYDSENRMVSMNSGAVTLVYDGDGNRVAKTIAGVTTRYLVDDLNPTGYGQVIEEVVGGAVQREYTYGLQRISENQVISGSWTTNFYGYDGMGTVRQLTSASGGVTDTYNYDAFGNRIGATGTTPNNYLYRGEQFDPDLGLYYLRARYYNPATGRFLSRDPNEPNARPFKGSLDPRKLHRYLYTGSNPVNRIDPRGRADEEEYAVRLDASVFASKFIAAIGCGASMGFYVAAATTDLTATWNGAKTYWPGTLAVAIGCAYAAYPGALEGAPSIAVDIVGGVGCTAGIYQSLDDYNRVLEDLSSRNMVAYSSDLTAFEEDFISGIFGCGISGIGGAWDVGGYYD
jgi:RHS repeat-associated protein